MNAQFLIGEKVQWAKQGNQDGEKEKIDWWDMHSNLVCSERKLISSPVDITFRGLDLFKFFEASSLDSAFGRLISFFEGRNLHFHWEMNNYGYLY